MTDYRLMVAMRLLVVSALLAGCQANTPPDGTSVPPATPAQPASAPSVTATSPGLSGPQRLLVLADNLVTVPADTTTDLPYIYIHTQVWARTTNAISRTDQRRWRHATNGSGQETIRRLPNLTGVKHRPTAEESGLLGTAPAKVHRYAADELRPYLAEPLPTDPTALTALLAPQGLATEPAYPRVLASGIVGLATSQYLDREQRAATLRVLAGIPRIAYLGESTDIAGRSGLAFAVTADGTTSTLIIEPRTGELLAAQEWLNTTVRPGLFSYVLILERGHAGGVTAGPPRPADKHPALPAADVADSTTSPRHPGR